jgi:hypothetical protein
MAFELGYENLERLHADDFSQGFARWHHEGIGQLEPAPGGGMRMHCHGSRQGAQGCMAFYSETLPDGVAVEYDLTVHSHGGLIINYIAIRGLKGEDLIADASKLRPRLGTMPNYYSHYWGLQSYHVSISRFNDEGQHSNTCNFRRNPGLLVMAHGVDLVQKIAQKYHIRLTKFGGHCALMVNGENALGFVDRDASRYPIPDYGKFGFRLIGSDVKADIADFKVFKLKPNSNVFGNTNNDAPELYGLKA